MLDTTNIQTHTIHTYRPDPHTGLHDLLLLIKVQMDQADPKEHLDGRGGIQERPGDLTQFLITGKKLVD